MYGLVYFGGGGGESFSLFFMIGYFVIFGREAREFFSDYLIYFIYSRVFLEKEVMFDVVFVFVVEIFSKSFVAV